MKIIRKTIIADEPYLRQISAEVDFSDKSYLEDIEKLKTFCKANFVFALSPVQVGIPKRIMYMKNTTTDPTKNTDPNYDESKIFINPKIIRRQGLTEYFETCASCPDPSLPYKTNDKENFYLCCSVPRPYLIEVEYYDINGVKQVETLTGFIATIFSHEYDHLNGILHIDYDTEMISMGFDARQEYRLSHPYKVISEDCPYSEPPKKVLKPEGNWYAKRIIRRNKII